MTEYWFARRFPIGNPRNGMAPIHWKGWVVLVVFLFVMLGGGAAFIWYALRDELAHGAAIFAVLGIVFGGWFALVSKANGDHVRTVADYKREKPGV